MIKERQSDFENHLMQVLEENLGDENFKIPKLCKCLGISRMQLHRNIRALENISTSIFVRNFRLEKATEMILSTNKNISQIAFEVGFRDPAYFCRCFKKRYNFAPSVLRKSIVQNK